MHARTHTHTHTHKQWERVIPAHTYKLAPLHRNRCFSPRPKLVHSGTSSSTKNCSHPVKSNAPLALSHKQPQDILLSQPNPPNTKSSFLLNSILYYPPPPSFTNVSLLFCPLHVAGKNFVIYFYIFMLAIRPVHLIRLVFIARIKKRYQL